MDAIVISPKLHLRPYLGGLIRRPLTLQGYNENKGKVYRSTPPEDKVKNEGVAQSRGHTPPAQRWINNMIASSVHDGHVGRLGCLA